MPTPLTPRPRRVALALAVGALLATAATSCKPTPPPVFTVGATATGPDISPGNGTCATAQGTCSLQAAIEEANALDTPTEVRTYGGVDTAVALTVTGTVVIDTGDETANSSLINVSWTVAEGASLAIENAALGPIVVDGTFVARRVHLGAAIGGPISGVPAVIQVGETGTALVTNGYALSMAAPLVHNEGVFVLHGSSIRPQDAPAPPAISTAPGGQTRLAGNAFLGGAAAADVCGGAAPTSFGYNLAPDTTCALTMTGDGQTFSATGWMPLEDDPRVDAIPIGTLHCGDGWDDDAVSGGAAVRPNDGNGDGTDACDIGARELWES